MGGDEYDFDEVAAVEVADENLAAEVAIADFEATVGDYAVGDRQPLYGG